MTKFRLSIAFAGILIAGWSATPSSAQITKDDDEAAKGARSQIRCAPRRGRERSQENRLESAFAARLPRRRTTNLMTPPREKNSARSSTSCSGNLKEAEAAIVKLNASEHSMRIDGHAIAGVLYEQMGDSEKARKHKAFFEGIHSTLFAPDLGNSFEKPIEVLFVDEEYGVLSGMKLKVKSQSLSEHNGHRFDVLTTHAQPGQPERGALLQHRYAVEFAPNRYVEDVRESQELRAQEEIARLRAIHRAIAPGSRPDSRLNRVPTAPTAHDFRLSLSFCRSPNTDSIPVQWAPRKF